MTQADAEALIAQSQRLLEQGRAAEALAGLDLALSRSPNHAAALSCRGFALRSLRRLDDALRAFDAVLEISPSVSARVNRAAMLQQLGRSTEALTECDRAIAAQADFAPAHCNRGLALRDLGRPLEALESYDRALELDANFVAAHGNRGKILQDLDRPEEALAAYDRVIRLQPAAAQARLNAAHAHLVLGQFERGWAQYEWRKRLAFPLGNRSFAKPLWLGSPDLAGRRILLHWEQGLGDTLQFCRYAKMAAARGAKVTLQVQNGLVRVLRSLGSEIEVRADELPSAEFDYHCPLSSLPHAFTTTLTSIPSSLPYLFAEPERVLHWRERVGEKGFKIGINWQGNKHSPADRGRSFPLKLFERIAALPGVRLISLQVGAGSEQLHALPPYMQVENLGESFDQGPDAFLDSAAVMQSLDLIITSDTALAHLAGALGHSPWVVLQHTADWRWLRKREDCPWYPGMRLFRQGRAGIWDDPFEALYGAIASKLGGHPSSTLYP